MFARNRIQNIQEPTILKLVWNVRGKTRFIVGELENLKGEVILRYFPTSNDYNRAVEKGFEPLRGFMNPQKEYREGVMDYFMSRITSRDRDDFGLYLETLGFEPNMGDAISDFALLGYGEGRLPSDGFQVINSFEDAMPAFEFVTEVAATMHCDTNDISIDFKFEDPVELVREPDNRFDEFAIKVIINKCHLGYINRIQAKTICTLMDQGHVVSSQLYRKNGRASAPRYFIFVNVQQSN